MPPADFETKWPAALNEQPRPPGMLPDWRLAVVAGLTDAEAKVEWLSPTGERRAAVLALSDVAWARPVRDGKPGAGAAADGRRRAGRRRGDDRAAIGAAEPPPVAPPMPAKGKAPPPPPAPPANRATLRQIPLVQGALVSLDPRTGRVLAMVGGWSFEQSQFNRATQANRQPGSSFKPIVYLTALEKGISPSQKFLDAPVVVDTPEGRWRPGNYEGTFSGPISLRVALEESMNLVTIRVAQQVGMEAVADNAIAFHMVDSMPRVLPAALGAVDTTVLREAGAYASIADGRAGGRADADRQRAGPRRPCRDARPPGLDCGDCADAAKPPSLTDERPQIADPDSVFQLITMMQGVVQRGTGVPAGQGLNRPIAGKTGTTQDFTDAWFAGFTPDLVTAVWVGFDNPASLGDNETGGVVAAPIWHDYMAIALKGRPVLSFPMPPGVTMAPWDSGRGTVTDAFKAGPGSGRLGADRHGPGQRAVAPTASAGAAADRAWRG